jgi:hypothetical protein
MSLKLSSLAFVLTISALLYGMSSTPAQAYLDPGTGSMVLQLLLGGVAGAAIAGRFYWDKFLTFVGAKRAAPQAEDAADQAAGRSKPQAD